MYNNRLAPGLRDEWEFEYRGSELSASAAKRMAFHAGREAHWDQVAEETEKEIHANGVKLTEQNITGGKRFVAELDVKLGDQLADARRRADAHRDVKEALEAYLLEFERTPSRVFSLKVPDLKFFGLVGKTVRFGDEILEA